MVGQNIGKYRVLDRVGRGGMGTVYRAIDETLHREVAIKVLNAELNDPEVAKRFRAEAITVARLSHPGIATIYELFQHDGQWLMVMEFVRGETLERLIERSGPQTPERGAELCMHSLAALAHAHSMGVVHRDLKPANIMLTENGVIKIMDFGIARVSGSEHLTNAGFMMGTPAYMAPEQVLGHEIDARADIYAMGVVFYRLLTGQLPFKGETPFAMAQAQVNNPPTPVSSVRADLPSWVDAVMTRSLAKKPEDRFQTALEFHEHFANCLSVAPAPAPAPYRSPTATNPIVSASQAVPGGTVADTVISTPRSGVSLAPPSSSTPAPASSSGTLPTFDDSGVGPTIAAGTPALQARPSTAELRSPGASGSIPAAPPATAHDPSGAQTMLSPSGAQAVIAKSGAQAADLFGSGSVPAAPSTSSGAVPVAPPASAPSAAGPVAQGVASLPPQKKSSTGLIAAAAVVLVVGAGAAYFLTRPAPPAPAPEPVATPVVEAPAPEPVAPPPSTPATSTATSAQPAAGTSAASPGARATAAGPGSAAAGSIGTAGTPTATTPATTVAGTPAAGGRATTPGGTRGTGAAPVDDSLLAVTDVRVLVVKGKKADDQEILLNFGNGQIALVNTKTGTPIATLPYRSIAGATYIRARDPRWNPELASPPTDLDVGGMLRTSKHFLALQTKDSYQILRLEDANVIRVLQAVEARTGLTIDRPKSGDRN